MRFSDDFVQRVLEANNLAEFISEVTQLKPSSGGFMGRCPFPSHPEKTASFSVSETKQVYHCFGCHKSGNLISFMRDYHGMNFPEAIEFLAGRARIEMPVADTARMSEDDKRAHQRKMIVAANKAAADFFEQQLKLTPSSNEAETPVQAYVSRRQLTEETVKLFRLGYAPAAWDGLAQYLARQNISPEIAEQAGLIRRRREGSGHYDMFRDRLMFPIHKISGDIIGFGGRIIEKGEPKYLNSPESPMFSKGKVLYGLDQTARYIRAKDTIVIVEGYMDLLALFQNGIQFVAATLGTALTADHAHAISNMTKNVVVLFDGDQAGQNASEKSLPILLQAGLRPKGLVLPDQLDPDEFILERGSELLQSEIQAAPDLFNLVIHQWTLNFRGSTTEKATLLEKSESLFKSMSDARLRDLYIADLAQRLQMNAQQIKKFFSEPRAGKATSWGTAAGSKPLPVKSASGSSTQANQTSQQNAGQVADAQSSTNPIWSVKSAPRAERILLGLALKNRANLETMIRESIPEQVSNADMRQIFQWILDSYRHEPAKFDRLSSLLTARIDDPGTVFELSLAMDVQEDQEAELLKDCVNRVQADALKFEIEKLRQDLKINPSPEGMEKLMQLQKDRLAKAPSARAHAASLQSNLRNEKVKDAE